MMEVHSLSEEGLGKLPLVARLILRHVHVKSAKIFWDENYLSLNNSQLLHTGKKRRERRKKICFIREIKSLLLPCL